jgi:protein-tyrosine-phosphatase
LRLLTRFISMNPNQPRFKILFICTGNSARSIFAEYLLKKIAPTRFETYSAGSNPKPAPHPLVLQILREDFKINASDAYSKSWDEFKDVPFNFVITLCDNARETCPVWPGQLRLEAATKEIGQRSRSACSRKRRQRHETCFRFSIHNSSSAG